jgi:hypothetical protein
LPPGTGKNRAKEKNAAKVQELFETHNDYPAEVSALICCFQIVNTDFFFLQAASEIKKQVELKMVPFATFNDTYCVHTSHDVGFLQRMCLSSMGKPQLITNQKFWRQ